MHKLIQEQFLPIPIEEAWQFFSTPKNLNEITPDDMVFDIISEIPDTMYEGLLIHYRLKPFLNIPINWCTEITHIKELNYFVDEQRIGPYKLWHHEHHFKSVQGGVVMTDRLQYEIGKSFMGWLAGIILVHKKVRGIFEFRKKVLETQFSRIK